MGEVNVYNYTVQETNISSRESESNPSYDITVFWKYENPEQKDNNNIKILLQEIAKKVKQNRTQNTKENPYIITDAQYNEIIKKPKETVYVIDDKYFTYDNSIDDFINKVGNLINAINVSNNIETQETETTIYKKIKRPDSQYSSDNITKGQRFFDKIVIILKDKEATEEKPYNITENEWSSTPLPATKVDATAVKVDATAATAAPPPKKSFWPFGGGRKSNKKRNGSKKNKNKKKKKSTQRK